jgi:hypothetical protein
MAHKMDLLRVDPVEFNGSWDGQQTVVVPGSTTAYAVLRSSQAVPDNCIWEVRRVVAGSQQSPLQTGGTEVFFSFAGNSDSDFSYAAWKDSTATQIPVPAFYSSGQFVAYAGQRIYMLVSGYSATLAYTFAGTAMQRLAAVPFRGSATV